LLNTNQFNALFVYLFSAHGTSQDILQKCYQKKCDHANMLTQGQNPAYSGPKNLRS